MTTARFRSTRNASSLVLTGYSFLVVLGGCGSDDPEVSTEAVEELAIPSTAALVEAAVPTAARAELALGDESFTFDSITCIGTSMASAVAADRANRDSYPTVTLRTFDLAMTGGMNSNTASVQFSGATRKELWVLHEGDVKKDGDIFKASGTLKGMTMQTQPDGTLKPQPLDGEYIRPFRIKIEC